LAFLDKILNRLGIKKLYLFIVGSYLGPLVLTFFIAVFILLMQFLWKYVDDMVGKGFEWYIIGELLFYASATFVPMGLPLAVLLASIMVFGNLGENYELVAMKASGVSFRKAMMPLVVFMLLVCGAAFYFSNNILPIANLKFSTLLFDVREKKPALNISEGIFYNEIEGYVIRIGSKEDDQKTIHDVMIYDHTADLGNVNVTLAERGIMEKSPDNHYLIFTLFDGYKYEELVEKRASMDNRPLQRTKFNKAIIRYDLSGFAMQRSNEELFKSSHQMLNVAQLDDTLVGLNREFEKKRENFYDFLTHAFFYFSSYDTNANKRPDSAQVLKPDFLSNFSKKEKMKITEAALASARNIYQQFGYTKEEFRVKKEYICKHKIEWHRKFTLSFACLVLFFIGAPLGAIIRRGGLGLPVVFATVFFLMFHILSMIGEKFVKEGVMPAYEGMWLASVVFLPVGVILTYSASTDAPLLDMEVWRSFFRRLVRVFRRSRHKPG
jgi:lipopolysaccharide export system permease protein